MNFKLNTFIYNNKITLLATITIGVLFWVIPSFLFHYYFTLPFVLNTSLNGIIVKGLSMMLTIISVAGFLYPVLYILFKIYKKKVKICINQNKICIIKDSNVFILNTNLNQIENILFKKISDGKNTAYIVKFKISSKVLFLRSHLEEDEINNFIVFYEELKKILIFNNWTKTEKHQNPTSFKRKLETQLFSKKH